MKNKTPKGFVRAKKSVTPTPGEMLRTLRELQEMTQAELARATGIAQSNISALENGRKHIGRERAVTLARALKVHPAVILFPDLDIEYVA
jgi:transcriptional regulator with XRE-family HTH domain